MKRPAIAGLTVFVAIFAAASQADAQVGSAPYEPLSVASWDSSSTYKSTVTTSGSFWFRLKVFHEGVIKHYSTTYVASTGTVDFQKLVTGMDNWGLADGDELTYRGRCWLVTAPWIYDQDDWLVPVDDPVTHLRPGRGHYARTWA